MGVSNRRERIDRGIKVRSEDIYALASLRDLLYLLLPRALPVAALLVLPLLGNVVGLYWLKVVLVTCLMALLALSWDLLASVGLVSLGQAIFFGVGGYLTGWMDSALGWPVLVTIPLATVVGAVLCAALLYPVLRLRGIYFALITLALPLLLQRIIEATKILGGTEGLSGLSPLTNPTLVLYLAVAVLLVTFFGFRRLIDSDYGLVLRGIRDNDRTVMASGINIFRVKAQAVFIAGLPATFAGALLTHYYQIASMQSFANEYSILPLTAAIVGGVGTFSGTLLGTFLLVPLSEALRSFGPLRVVVYSLILVVFVVGVPEGIFPFLRRKYQQFERLRSLEEQQ